jgi:hypothetical protein
LFRADAILFGAMGRLGQNERKEWQNVHEGDTWDARQVEARVAYDVAAVIGGRIVGPWQGRTRGGKRGCLKRPKLGRDDE